MTKIKTIISLLTEQILNEIDLEVPIREPLDLEIPINIKTLSNIFQNAGYKLYIVGGAVRDALLNKTPKDYLPKGLKNNLTN